MAVSPLTVAATEAGTDICAVCTVVVEAAVMAEKVEVPLALTAATCH